MRIVDWISDVCSSDLVRAEILADPEMAVDPNEDLRSFAEVLDRHIAIDGAGYWDGEIFTGMGSTPSMQEAAMLAARLDEALPAVQIVGEGNEAMRGGVLAEIGRASCRERVCQYV